MRSAAAFATLMAMSLSACTFTSEEPLFDPQDAVALFPDGAQFEFEVSDFGRPSTLTYERSGTGYLVSSNEPNDLPLLAQFVPVPQTVEDDYIVQAQAANGTVFYGFMMRGDEVDLLVAAPSDLLPNAGSQGGCAAGSAAPCVFSHRRQLLQFYRRVVHPVLTDEDGRLTRFATQRAIAGSIPGE